MAENVSLYLHVSLDIVDAFHFIIIIVCLNRPETYEYSMTFYSVFVNLRKKCALDCCTITNLKEINHNSPIA